MSTDPEEPLFCAISSFKAMRQGWDVETGEGGTMENSIKLNKPATQVLVHWDFI